MNKFISFSKNIFNRISNLKDYLSMNFIAILGYFYLLFIVFAWIICSNDNDIMGGIFAIIVLVPIFIIITLIMIAPLIILFVVEKCKKINIMNNLTFCIGLFAFILLNIFLIYFYFTHLEHFIYKP